MHIVDKNDNQVDVHVVLGRFLRDYLCVARFLSTLSTQRVLFLLVFVFGNRFRNSSYHCRFAGVDFVVAFAFML